MNLRFVPFFLKKRFIKNSNSSITHKALQILMSWGRDRKTHCKISCVIDIKLKKSFRYLHKMS